MLITTLVVSFLVCCRLEVRCGYAGVVSIYTEYKEIGMQCEPITGFECRKVAELSVTLHSEPQVTVHLPLQAIKPSAVAYMTCGTRVTNPSFSIHVIALMNCCNNNTKNEAVLSFIIQVHSCFWLTPY